MGKNDELTQSFFSIVSDALKAPVAALAASDLLLVIVIGLAYFSSQTQMALVLSGVLFISLIVTLVSVLSMRRFEKLGSFTRHEEPEVIRGAKEVETHPVFNWRLEEHYNTELDPSISYIISYVSAGQTTVWHRLKDLKDPVEARFYVLSGTAHFELLEPVSRRMYSYDLNRGDSLVVPDSFWRRWTNTSNQESETIVICIPRWRREIFEYHIGTAAELPK
jgi:amino acid transporter